MKRKSLLAILLAASMAASMTAATATVAFAETEEAAETAEDRLKTAEAVFGQQAVEKDRTDEAGL